MVALGALVPHQLFVAVTAEPGALAGVARLLLPVTAALLPANRLKLMVAGPPAGPTKTPPPTPVPEPAGPDALFPVIVTMERGAPLPAFPLSTPTPPPDAAAAVPL